MCLKRPHAAVKFIERQLKYKNQKTGEEVDQFIFFEKLNLKRWSVHPGYFKPFKDELARDFARTFTPEVVGEFIENLRRNELENKVLTNDNFVHHRAIASLLLYSVSKCVQLAFDEYKRNNYTEEAPNWSGKVTKTWLGTKSAEFLLKYISAYAENDDSQRWFAKAVMIHLEQMVQNYKKICKQLAL